MFFVAHIFPPLFSPSCLVKTGLEVTDPKCVCVCLGLICLLYNFSLACVVASLFMNVDDCAGEGENDMVVLAADRQAAIQRQKEEAKKRRRKKKRTGSSLFASTFNGNNLLKFIFLSRCYVKPAQI